MDPRWKTLFIYSRCKMFFFLQILYYILFYLLKLINWKHWVTENPNPNYDYFKKPKRYKCLVYKESRTNVIKNVF
jgi:hypothetical protein